MQDNTMVLADPVPTLARRTYLRHAISHPLILLPLVAGVAFGIVLESAVLAVMAMFVVVIGAIVVSAHPRCRRALHEQLERERRRERIRRREAALEAASISGSELAELARLTCEVERIDPPIAQRFGLEDLLDLYVELAIARDRCRHTLGEIDGDELIRALRDTPDAGGLTALRRRLLEHRLRCRDECYATARRLDERIASLVELVRLLAQRASLPRTPGDEDAIERRLADLEREDDAFQEIALADR